MNFLSKAVLATSLLLIGTYTAYADPIAGCFTEFYAWCNDMPTPTTSCGTKVLPSSCVAHTYITHEKQWFILTAPPGAGGIQDGFQYTAPCYYTFTCDWIGGFFDGYCTLGLMAQGGGTYPQWRVTQGEQAQQCSGSNPGGGSPD